MVSMFLAYFGEHLVASQWQRRNREYVLVRLAGAWMLTSDGEGGRGEVLLRHAGETAVVVEGSCAKAAVSSA